MKYAATVLALVAAVSAQSVADLPSCSLECVINGVSGVGCSATDFACSCKKADQLTPAITPCVQTACTDTADQEKVITVLEGICAAAGFPITVPEPGSSSAAPAPSSSAAPPAESSVAPTVQTSAPTPSATDVVISGSPAPLIPYSTAESSCGIVTVTETVTGKPSAPVVPYPTGPAGTGAPKPYPTGTGVYTAPPAYFTGAASSVKVPAGIAGMLGLVAYIL